MTILSTITTLLQGHNLEFRTLHHEATHTSEASARARGENISIGAKAIVMKIDEKFILLVLSAALRIDSKSIKQHFNARSVRFATPQELHDLTGLVPGSVPPFGRPILDLDLYVDNSVLVNDKVAFNAGSLTDSIIMRTSDYRSISGGAFFDFSRRQDAQEG